jgi:PAS domain S-box-containing protein
VASWKAPVDPAPDDEIEPARRAIHSMPIGLMVLDTHWRVVHINPAGEAAVGFRYDELVGRDYWEAFPANRDNEFGRAYRQVVTTRRPQMVEAFYPEPLNRWFEVHAVPEPDGLSLYFTEVTDRRLAQERLALLARVGTELAGTLDAASAARRIPSLVSPILATWCTLTLLGGDGSLRVVGSWHVDPEQRHLVEGYAEARAHLADPVSPLGRALQTGRPVVDTWAALADPRPEDDAGQLLSRLSPGTVTALPVAGRERMLGVLTLGHDRRRRVAQADVSTAQQVADRLGLALDNARLYDQQRRLAEELQRGLLTDPPQSDDAEIVVRYLPASEAARVGGDWYDAFVLPSGVTALVIGDVVGHDTAAAAAMGQLRSLLRGISVGTESGPAGLLTALDAAMEQLQLGTQATAAVACLDPAEDGVVRMLWGNAGHPPPLVLSPEGIVRELGGPRGELMLGVDAGVRRTETTEHLLPGSTVVLYTDGLVERRDQDLDAGTARLRAAAEDLAGEPLDALCDGLVHRLVEGRPDDDVALVALRLPR